MADKTLRHAGLVRRRLEFDGETWHALRHLSLDTGKSLQQLADEASVISCASIIDQSR